MERPGFDRALVEKYDRPGPRYTSYPTAPQFHDGFGEEDYRAAARRSNEAAAPKPLSVYVHIPFCRSLCYYCACNKIITSRTERAAEYLELLATEIALQGELFDRSRRIEQLHLGGGTPTYFTDEQLAHLFALLRGAFVLDETDGHEFSIEVDPRTVGADRIRFLRTLGFNRLSLGVQDFDPDVQLAVNRIQSVQQVRELVDAAREARFHSVSFDLIYGLPLQTVDSFATTLDHVVSIRPDRVAAYSYAHLPDLVKGQRMIRPDDMPPPERKFELLELTIERLLEAGYVHIGMDHFALPDDELTLARANGSLHRNFQGYSTHADCDLIGLGVSAIGQVADTYSQNVKLLSAYQALLAQGRLPLHRGLRLTDEDLLRRRVIQDLMCHGRVEFAPIEREHGIVFREHFARSLHALAEPVADGLVSIGEHVLELLPQGQLMMRNVAMAFDAWLDTGRARFSRTI